MAIYVITVAGSTKTIQPGWSISETANGRNRLSCDVVSVPGTYRPALGADVILTENGTRIFGGTIDTANEAGAGGLGLVPIVTKITAIDYNGLAERRYVNIVIAAGTLKAALTAIVAYLSPAGVTLDAAQVNGPTLPAIPLAYMRVDEALNQLSQLTTSGGTRYVWEIDYNKVLRMFLPASVAAPFNITDTPAGGALGDVTVEPSRTDYANRVLVLAGEGLREVTDTFTGDGVTTAFTLRYTLASSRGYVTNNGVNETLGTGATWTHDPVAYTITRTSAPANLAPISITYTAQFPVLAFATDSAALAADGGVLWEKIILEPEVFDVAVAQALANAYVAQAVLKPRTARYTTLQLGVHPGQTQTITKAARNLSGTWLITDVVIRSVSATVVERQVTATEGTLFVGSWRDTVKAWSGARSTSGGGGVVAIVSGGGSAAGSGTIGSLAQWATISTLGDATAVPAALLTGTIAGARLPAFTGDVASSVGTVALAIQNGVITNAMVNAAAAIAWSKLDKTGSSLADLTTRSAGDLASGNLAYARMPSGSGTWTAIPTISGIATFSSDVVASANIGTSNFASQTTGWRITSAGAADVRNLYTDEFTAKSFIADLEQALAGGQIITKSVAVLASTFTAPAAGAATTLVVEDLPSAPNMAVFVSGDTVVLRSFTRAGGALTISDCVGVVTAYVDG